MNITGFGTQKEQIDTYVKQFRPCQLLDISVEYDSTHPEETIRTFIKSVRSMISRYEDNNARVNEIENELQDLEHYMEVGNYKNVPEGYRMYRRMAELRRERRACKNEIDLLWPVYEYFHATEVLNRLSKLQGDCSKVRETIDGRTYTVRTDVLNEWLEAKSAEEPEEESFPEVPGLPDEEKLMDESMIHHDVHLDIGKAQITRKPKMNIYEEKGEKKSKFVKVWEEKEVLEKCIAAK